ncbi:unnamed protein product [Brachionus calyciflorus]|uniref:Uncharacterized protein n=1 Tax=Brachionus calyciflorus TaxID=104777 RepID=A0A813UD35_9BILA|nr:unnamed protein product [Brachionus calyciflorus]
MVLLSLRSEFQNPNRWKLEIKQYENEINLAEFMFTSGEFDFKSIPIESIFLGLISVSSILSGHLCTRKSIVIDLFKDSYSEMYVELNDLGLFISEGDGTENDSNFNNNLKVEISQLLELTDNFFHDYENFITVEKIMRINNVKFIELPKKSKCKIIELEEFFEVELDVGVRKKIELLQRCMSVDTIASTNSNMVYDENLMLFTLDNHDDIYDMFSMEREYLRDIMNFI